MIEDFAKLLRNPNYRGTVLAALNTEIEDCKQMLEDYLSGLIPDQKHREVMIGNLKDLYYEHNRLVELFNTICFANEKQQLWDYSTVDAHIKRMTPMTLRVV